MTLSSVAKSRQKGRSRVNNLDVRQSRQANDSASMVKRAKENFAIAKCQRKRSKRPNKNAAVIERV